MISSQSSNLEDKNNMQDRISQMNSQQGVKKDSLQQLQKQQSSQDQIQQIAGDSNAVIGQNKKKKNKKKKNKNKNKTQEENLSVKNAQQGEKIQKQVKNAQVDKNILFNNLNSKQTNTGAAQNLINSKLPPSSLNLSLIGKQPLNQPKRRQTFQIKRQLFPEQTTRSISLNNSATNDIKNVFSLNKNNLQGDNSKVTKNMNPNSSSSQISQNEVKALNNIFGQFFKLQNLKNYSKIKTNDQNISKTQQQNKQTKANNEGKQSSIKDQSRSLNISAPQTIVSADNLIPQFRQQNNSMVQFESSKQQTPKKSFITSIAKQTQNNINLTLPNNSQTLLPKSIVPININQSRDKITQNLSKQTEIKRPQVYQSINPISPPSNIRFSQSNLIYNSSLVQSQAHNQILPPTKQPLQLNANPASDSSQNNIPPNYQNHTSRLIESYQKQLPPIIMEQKQFLQQSPSKSIPKAQDLFQIELQSFEQSNPNDQGQKLMAPYEEPEFMYLNKQLTQTPLVEMESNAGEFKYLQNQNKDQNQISFGLQFPRPTFQTFNSQPQVQQKQNNSFFETSTIPLVLNEFPSFNQSDFSGYPQIVTKDRINYNHNQNIENFKHSQNPNNFNDSNVSYEQIQGQNLALNSFPQYKNHLKQSHNKTYQKRQIQFQPIQQQLQTIQKIFKKFNIQNKLSIDNLSYNSTFQTFENISSNLLNQMEKSTEDSFIKDLVQEKQFEWKNKIMNQKMRKQKQKQTPKRQIHINKPQVSSNHKIVQNTNQQPKVTTSQSKLYKIKPYEQVQTQIKMPQKNNQSINLTSNPSLNPKEKLTFESNKKSITQIPSQIASNNQSLKLKSQDKNLQISLTSNSQLNQPKPTQSNSPVKHRFLISRLYEQKIVPTTPSHESSQVKKYQFNESISNYNSFQTSTVKPLFIRQPLKSSQVKIQQLVFDQSLESIQHHQRQHIQPIKQMAKHNKIDSLYQLLQSSRQFANSNERKYPLQHKKSYVSIQKQSYNTSQQASGPTSKADIVENEIKPSSFFLHHKHELKQSNKPVIQNKQFNTRKQRSISFGKQQSNPFKSKPKVQFVLPKQIKIEHFIKGKNNLVQSRSQTPLSNAQMPPTFRAQAYPAATYRQKQQKCDSSIKINKPQNIYGNTISNTNIISFAKIQPQRSNKSLSYSLNKNEQYRENELSQQPSKEFVLPIRKIYPIKLSQITLNSHGRHNKKQKQNPFELKQQKNDRQKHFNSSVQNSRDDGPIHQNPSTIYPQKQMNSFLFNTSKLGSFMLNNVIKSLTDFGKSTKKQQVQTQKVAKQNISGNIQVQRPVDQKSQLSNKKKITIKKSNNQRDGKKISINQHSLHNLKFKGDLNKSKELTPTNHGQVKLTPTKSKPSTSQQSLKQSVYRINKKIQQQIRSLSKSKLTEKSYLKQSNYRFNNDSTNQIYASNQNSNRKKTSIYDNLAYSHYNKDNNLSYTYQENQKLKSSTKKYCYQNSAEKSIKNSQNNSLSKSKRKHGIQLWNEGLSQLKSSRRNSGNKSPKIFPQSNSRISQKIVGITRWNQNLSRYKNSRSQSKQSNKSRRSDRSISNQNSYRRYTGNLEPKNVQLYGNDSSSKKIGIEVKRHKYQTINVQKKYI